MWSWSWLFVSFYVSVNPIEHKSEKWNKMIEIESFSKQMKLKVQFNSDGLDANMNMYKSKQQQLTVA